MSQEMMHEALGRIVEAGRKELDRLGLEVQGTALRAAETIGKADEEMKALVAFAESIPAAIFDRFSNVFVGIMEVGNDAPHPCEPRLEVPIGIPYPVFPRQVYGKGFQKGKYRVILTMEKIG